MSVANPPTHLPTHPQPPPFLIPASYPISRQRILQGVCGVPLGNECSRRTHRRFVPDRRQRCLLQLAIEVLLIILIALLIIVLIITITMRITVHGKGVASCTAWRCRRWHSLRPRHCVVRYIAVCSYHVVSYNIISDHVVSCHLVPPRYAPFHALSRIVLCSCSCLALVRGRGAACQQHEQAGELSGSPDDTERRHFIRPSSSPSVSLLRSSRD